MFLEQKRCVAEAEKAVLLFDGFLVKSKRLLLSAKRAHQHNERGLRQVEVGDQRYAAAVNIGVAPTYGRVADTRRRIEAHLLNFSGNLYGKRLRLELGEYLRCEQCFPNEEALKRQIACDVEKIRQWAENKL